MKTQNTIDKELRDKMADVLGQSSVSEKTARDILLICKNGLDPRQALALRGVLNPNKDTVTHLKQKAERWMLANPGMQKLAHNVAKSILKGQPIVGEYTENNEVKQHVMKPNMSQAVAVIDMITKRTEPIQSQGVAREHNTYIQINMDEFKPQDMVMDESDKMCIDHESL